MMKNYLKIVSVIMIFVLVFCSISISVNAVSFADENLIKLPSEVFHGDEYETNYNYFYLAPEIITTESDDCFYIATEGRLYKHDIASNDTALVDSYYYDEYDENFDSYNIRVRYVVDNKIYISLCTTTLRYDSPIHSKILCYDLTTHKMSTVTDFYGYIVSAIGADKNGRIYLNGSPVSSKIDKFGDYLFVLDSSGNQLSKYMLDNEINSFVDFDAENDCFYVNEKCEYIDGGFAYDMCAIKKGYINSNNEVSFDSDIITLVAEYSYSERPKQAEVLADRFLAVDATEYDSFLLYDLNEYGTEKKLEPMVSAYHSSDDGGFDKFAISGTRCVYMEETNSIFYCADDNTIEEFNPDTKETIGVFNTQFDIYAMKELNGKLLIIERNNGDYFYNVIEIKRPDTLVASPGELTLKVGDGADIQVEINGTYSFDIQWETDNPHVATVNNDGTVFAWSEGTATITATSSGLSANITVTVVSDPSNVKSAWNTTNITNRFYNVGYNNYDAWSSPVNSYIYENDNGNYTVVYGSNDGVYIDTYSSDFASVVSTKRKSNPLTYFGGCYFAADYNFLVFGQENFDENDKTEVVRVQKYSKNWELIDELSLYGENTYIPFDAGSLRMTETQGLLYVHTCHEMYDHGDGLNHQANMTFVVNIEDMSLNQIFSDVFNLSQAGYVSHSFNQFVVYDDEYVYRVDHGDAFPRGIAITKAPIGADITDIEYIIPITVEGMAGDNTTGTSVGGVEVSTDNIIIAGNIYTDAENQWSCPRNVFINISKKDFSETETIYLTQFDNESVVTARTPHLIKLGDDQFMVVWEERNMENNSFVTKMLTFDSNGNIASDTAKLPFRLSDCAPVLTSDGTVKWYTADDKKTTVYSVDPLKLNEISKCADGDVNCDGKTTIKDATTIQKHLAKIMTLTNVELFFADTSHDGKVSISDATKIQKYLAKIITQL